MSPLSIPLLAYAIGQWEGYAPAPHHRLIAQALHRVALGGTKRLMIFMPPRHGKSMLASEFFPAWYLGVHPDHQVIAATYAQELANDFGRKVRNLCRTPQHATLFPGFSLSDDSQAACRFHTPQRGVYQGVGVGGAATGRGAHLLLVDDPIKNREEAESETRRRLLKDWYTSTAYTRLMPGGAVVVIQTRWHEDDLAGWLLREHAHESWEVLNLPAIAEPGDPLGRAEGDALWPDAYPAAVLGTIRKTAGPRDWASLYQQRPAAMEGAIFRREHWRYFDPPADEPRALCQALGVFRVIQAWDTAFKAGEANDYSVGVTLGVSANRYHLLDVWRARVEFPELRQAVVAQHQKWGSHAVLVENAASGQSLIQELQRNTRIPLQAIRADRDKVSRAHAVTATHAAGLVWLPNGAHWAADFTDEMASFPAAPHDDQVDAFVHALTYATANVGAAPTAPEDDEEAALAGGGENSWMG